MRGYEFFLEKVPIGWQVWKRVDTPRLYPMDTCLMWYPDRQTAEALVEFLVTQEKELEGGKADDISDRQS